MTRRVKRAKCKKAWAISDRSGLRFKYNEMIYEPGTNHFIHYSESDGKYNFKDHPQNHIRTRPEDIALRDARGDVTLTDSIPGLQTNEGLVIFTSQDTDIRISK